MHAIILVFGAIVFLSWLGFELKGTHRELSWGLFAASGLLGLMLLGAIFDLYGEW